MADEAIESFWEELDSGEVHIRDQWQFALKSEFFPKEGKKTSQYIQEFYLFIPNSLQINANTYAKQAFYLDETNLIRYKTPAFSFEQLLDLHSERSPLTRVLFLCRQEDNEHHRESLSDELKLLANVVRSTLRREVKELVVSLGAQGDSFSSHNFIEQTLSLCRHIEQLRERFAGAEQQCLDHWHDPLFYRQMLYIDEFMSYSISHYLTGLLESIRLSGRSDLSAGDQALCDVLLKEKQLSDLFATHDSWSGDMDVDSDDKESVLYRYGLLNKFVLEALQIATNRFSLDQRYQHWIGAVSAGVAMLIYFSFFVWLGNVFVINSAPFVILTVVFYVLKDRIKEWLRTFSYLQASRWFPDYTTVIKAQGEKGEIGIMQESFSFLEPLQLSQELKTIRNAEFHNVLETVQRPENILFYKRMITINALPLYARRHGINVIFRFNLHDFLRKASDPIETHLVIDPTTRKLVRLRLPKVYHLNLIMRSTTLEEGKSPVYELKKLRIIVDKKGIKRIENV